VVKLAILDSPFWQQYPMTDIPRSYTTIDVAKRLGVSLQTVQRWVDAGHLKAWKTLGGHRRIEASSAELLFRQQEDRMGATDSIRSDRGQASNASVVVVDDDPLDLALLVMLVRNALPDATVEAAANGFQGLVAIGKTSPQIVITDIHMPHMDGFEMIRTLWEDEAGRPRTLMAVSAMTRQELAAIGTLPAQVQVFTKPLDQARFAAALRNAS
jgi:excisionase family DNA binding protein